MARIYLRFGPGRVLGTNAPLAAVSPLLRDILDVNFESTGGHPSSPGSALEMPPDCWDQVDGWVDVLECLDRQFYNIERFMTDRVPLKFTVKKAQRMLPVLKQWQIGMDEGGLWNACIAFLKQEQERNEAEGFKALANKVVSATCGMCGAGLTAAVVSEATIGYATVWWTTVAITAGPMVVLGSAAVGGGLVAYGSYNAFKWVFGADSKQTRRA